LVFNLPRLVSFYSYASGAQLYSRDEILLSLRLLLH
jgi:hypothetical protein